MKTIVIEEYIAAVRKHFPDVQLPKMIAGKHCFLFTEEYLRGPWSAHWTTYLRNRNFVYVPGSGMCEHFASEAADESNWGVLQGNYGDTVSSMSEARVTIPQDSGGLNGILDGGHATCLVGVRSGRGSWDLFFWEPQFPVYNEQTATHISRARDLGVKLYDLIV